MSPSIGLSKVGAYGCSTNHKVLFTLTTSSMKRRCCFLSTELSM